MGKRGKMKERGIKYRDPRYSTYGVNLDLSVRNKGEIYDSEADPKERRTHIRRDSKWISFDEAIGMLYPAVCKTLEATKKVLSGDQIDKMIFRNDHIFYNILNIGRYIIKFNKGEFVKGKSFKRGDEIIISTKVRKGETVEYMNRLKTPQLFDRLSRSKGLRFKGSGLDIEKKKEDPEYVDVKPYIPNESYRQHYGINMFNLLIKRKKILSMWM